MRTTELDASGSADGTYRKEREIRTRVEQPPRVPMWIAEISMARLAVAPGDRDRRFESFE